MWHLSHGLSHKWQVADAVFVWSVVVALPADLMVKTVGGQARSCAVLVRFHITSIDHGFKWNRELPPYIIALLPPFIQQLEGVSRWQQ
jgi:hypothetical protein